MPRSPVAISLWVCSCRESPHWPNTSGQNTARTFAKIATSVPLPTATTRPFAHAGALPGGSRPSGPAAWTNRSKACMPRRRKPGWGSPATGSGRPRATNPCDWYDKCSRRHSTIARRGRTRRRASNSGGWTSPSGRRRRGVQFQPIVKDIRAQKFNADAGDSSDFVEFLGRAGQGNSKAANLQVRQVGVLVCRNRCSNPGPDCGGNARGTRRLRAGYQPPSHNSQNEGRGRRCGRALSVGDQI